MIAVGCLLVVILPIAGLAIGGYLAGREAALWAAAAGLCLGIALCGFSAYALIRAGRRR